MQRFAGLNSIEGWNLTLQLSSGQKVIKKLKKRLAFFLRCDIILFDFKMRV